ncbi:MAG: RluA family pseudouridine synthase [Verrucomicrobia bacterium]|nr:RluA family pseudouridine synthase [Verrucomicrobiota bacterium]
MDARDLEILYEDNHLLAVYKPAGVLSQGDETGDPTLLDAAKAWLKDKYAKPGKVFLGLVHRLDRPVAGVLLFARTSKAAARLSAEFREGRVEKVYRAVVEGTPKPPEQTLTGLMLKDEEARRSHLVKAGTPGAREVELHYRMLGTAKSISLLEITPRTGRSHQIRAQLAGIGYPILGDVKYGASAPLPSGAIALYARAISFRHPTRNETVEIAAGPPPDWPWPPTDPGRGCSEKGR